jgi:ribosomal protein L37AE/L43A
MNEIRIDGPRSSARKTALVLELNSFKPPEPSEEAVAQVEKVLNTQIEVGVLCNYCKVKRCVNQRGLDVHIWRTPKCKAAQAKELKQAKSNIN